MNNGDLSAKCLELAIKYHAGQMRGAIEPYINHPKRMGQRALIAEYSDIVVACCYVHDVLDMNRDLYYEIGQELKAIDEDVFRIVDKIAKREHESWKEYYGRVIDSPGVKEIVWLDHLDILPDTDSETRTRMLQFLPMLVQ